MNEELTISEVERDYISFTFYMYSIPLDAENFMSIDEAVTFVEENGLSEDVEISENMYGVTISFYNNVGANGNYMIPDLSTFIKEDEEGSWSQYQAFIERMVIPEEGLSESYMETSYSISSFIERKVREKRK